MSVKVVTLKAKPPIEGGDVVASQAYVAHRYYNRLIELHREFACEREAAKRKHCPNLEVSIARVEQASTLLQSLQTQVKALNALSGRKRATSEERRAIKAAKDDLKAARLECKMERQAAKINPAYIAELGTLIQKYHGVLPPAVEGEEPSERRQGGLFKEARANCGVYSGTYLRVEAAVDQAVGDAVFEPPEFRRWSGRARVGPQLVPPISVAEAMEGKSSRLRIERIRTPAGKNCSDRLLVWLRVSSDEGRNPVWAKVPCHLSKGQLPADAIITWATLLRRQVGVRRHRHPDRPEGVYLPYYEWEVQLTIKHNIVKERARTGRAGINFGWRLMEGGTLLAATLVDETERVERFVLPKKLLERFSRVRDIQEIRDRNFNNAKQSLISWLSGRAVPEWLTEAVAHLPQWRSIRRLAMVYNQWGGNRFAGDETVFAILQAWRDRDAHLEQYQLPLSLGAIRRRKALFRQWAASIRKRFAVVAVEDTDYTTLKRKPQADSNDFDNEIAKRHLHWAAPGEFRECVVEAGAVKFPAEDITRSCHVCGSIEDWDQSNSVTHTCSECGSTWDQDVNAALNLLARAAEADDQEGTSRDPDGGAGAEVTTTDPQQGGKWAKRKADRSQKASQAAAQTGVA